MNNLTVTFGGREWVLRKSKRLDCRWVGFNGGTDPRLEVEMAVNDKSWLAYFRSTWPTMFVGEKGDSPQAAVSAVEAKLRSLHSELGALLYPKETE